ncbi:11189_t:CDS:2 [Scutellospora calospora]|uniref:11189_t:CDS:1 n=1 Tax=Scutellospora calospora TaxID=85575 RepID=A0ACA9JTS7_9GLOM|nr:11189_t:CDS:2 [Scutellospora calospora]
MSKYQEKRVKIYDTRVENSEMKNAIPDEEITPNMPTRTNLEHKLNSDTQLEPSGKPMDKSCERHNSEHKKNSNNEGLAQLEEKHRQQEP